MTGKLEEMWRKPKITEEDVEHVVNCPLSEMANSRTREKWELCLLGKVLGSKGGGFHECNEEYLEAGEGHSDCDFWVGIFNLPLDWMDEATGRMIEDMLGKCTSVDVGEDGLGWGELLQVRLSINV
ncbi:hypothetical protein ACH5RR_013059 [Cinchona calisaya]|uniref:Uncharacterized protein n=1 Tax=Cinchona calisaya TaxID=153742 RepID=A0ABD3A2M1_9GENT